MVPNPFTIIMIGLIVIQSRDYFPEGSQKVQVCLDLSNFMCPYSGLKEDLCFLLLTYTN